MDVANSGKAKWIIRGIMNCKNCGIPLKRGTIYCSNSCQKNYEYKKYIRDWKKGLVNGMKGKYQISNHVRHYLYEKYDYKCAKCGWNKINPYSHVVPLEIEL